MSKDDLMEKNVKMRKLKKKCVEEITRLRIELASADKEAIRMRRAEKPDCVMCGKRLLQDAVGRRGKYGSGCFCRSDCALNWTVIRIRRMEELEEIRETEQKLKLALQENIYTLLKRPSR